PTVAPSAPLRPCSSTQNHDKMSYSSDGRCILHWRFRQVFLPDHKSLTISSITVKGNLSGSNPLELALPALPAHVRAMQPILYPQDIESRFPQIFPVLEHEQIDLIRSLGGPPRRFAPGEQVVAAGGLPRMFVVLEGSVDVVRSDGLGNELLLASYGAGQFSG